MKNALVVQNDSIQHYYGVNEEFDPVDALWTLITISKHLRRGGGGIVVAVYAELTAITLTQCHLRLSHALQR